MKNVTKTANVSPGIWYTEESPAEIRMILESLPSPISSDNVTNDQMVSLIKDIDSELYQRFGTTDLDSMNNYEKDKLDEAWWDILEHLAISEYGMKYYEDIDEE